MSSVVSAPSTHSDVANTLASTSPVPFTATLRAEWSKFITVRSTWLSAVLVVIVSCSLTGLLAWVTGWSWQDWNDADRASFDPILFTMTGMAFGAIILVVMGVNAVASEYSSGMIRQTFTTTPKRGRILIAKLLVVVAITIVVSAVAFVATFYVGQWIYGIYDLPTVGLGDSEARRSMIGLILTSPIMPIIGALSAFVFRSAAAAITFSLALIFLPSMIGAFLPRRWQEDVLAFLPANLGDSIAIGHLDPDNPQYSDPWLAAGLLAVWAVVLIGGTWLLINRRDV